MGRNHRLGSLQVSVGRHDDVQVGVTTGHERTLKIGQLPVQAIDRVPRPKPQVGRNLVVATSRRVQLAADIAQSIDECLFDVHMDIFEFLPQGQVAAVQQLPDLAQRRLNLLALVATQETHVGEHSSMGNRTGDVVGVQPVVETNALGERLDASIGRPLEDAATGGTGHRA